jgi:hypothetical protein
MKTWTPDTEKQVAEYHRGQLNEQARMFGELYGDDPIIKFLRTRQTPITSADYLRLPGKPRGEIDFIEALTAPPVTKANAALGGMGSVAGKGSMTSYAPGYSPGELSALLGRARSGDVEAAAERQAFARTEPTHAGDIIEQHIRMTSASFSPGATRSACSIFGPGITSSRSTASRTEERPTAPQSARSHRSRASAA